MEKRSRITSHSDRTRDRRAAKACQFEPTDRATCDFALSLPCLRDTDVHSSIYAAGVQRLFLIIGTRSEEHTSELQSHLNLVCRLLLEKKKTQLYFNR